MISNLDGDEDYKISGSWFKQKVGGLLEKEKAAYLDIWQTLNEHIVQLESGINEKERVSKITYSISSYQCENIIALTIFV